jgi:polar amino acid transport system substrate-binding protein
MKSLTRRRMLSATGSVALASTALWSACGSAFAKAPPEKGQGLLAKLQAAKKVRIGFPNQPPFSALNPDGTVTGAAPTITKTIMARLGIPGIEGFLASYGELIPGMMADRWDFVSAALTITKARCAQVRFGDPIIFDGDNIVAIKGHPGPMPKRLSELAKGGFVVGAPAGGADVKALLAAGVTLDNIRQFTNDPSEIDALLAKRIDFGVMSPSGVHQMIKQRNLDLEITYPVEDDPPRGSACAFRLQDTDLHDAYVTEMRKMRASGELIAILKSFGYDSTIEQLSTPVDQLCAVS